MAKGRHIQSWAVLSRYSSFLHQIQEGVPAFTVEQPTEGFEILQQRALELKVGYFSVTSIAAAETFTPGL